MFQPFGRPMLIIGFCLHPEAAARRGYRRTRYEIVRTKRRPRRRRSPVRRSPTSITCRTSWSRVARERSRRELPATPTHGGASGHCGIARTSTPPPRKADATKVNVRPFGVAIRRAGGSGNDCVASHHERLSVMAWAENVTGGGPAQCSRGLAGWHRRRAEIRQSTGRRLRGCPRRELTGPTPGKSYAVQQPKHGRTPYGSYGRVAGRLITACRRDSPPERRTCR